MEENLDFTNGFIQNNPWPIPNKTLIIAEIGINHNGDIAIAKKLIDMAKNAGCDYVKFQKRTIDIVYSKDILDSHRESPWGNTQREQKEALEFDKTQYDEIDSYCKEKSIGWFASAWDIPSQLFLKDYNFKYNKIASPMITHIDLLKMVAEEKKLTFISTGMSTYDDIDKAVEIFNKNNCPFVLNHCVSEYPIAEDKINLKGMTQGMLVVLGEQNIKKLKDFAELSSDELIGGMDEIKGKRIKINGYLEEFALTREEADNLIMDARKIVFEN